MATKNFRDLNVWRIGKQIVLDTYRVSGAFPSDERFGLCQQMRRAAVSVPSNIAEGFNRFHNREYRQFLYFALGSCAELETQCELARELGFLELDTAAQILELIDHESRMLRNLIKKL